MRGHHFFKFWRPRSPDATYLTLTNRIHRDSIWMHCYIKEHNSNRKMHFSIFPFQSLREQYWPCHKISQGQPRVIVYINFKELNPQVLHTEFQAIGPVVLEKKIYLRFLPYMGMVAILVMWPAQIYINFTFFLTWTLYMKLNWNWPCSFRGEVLWTKVTKWPGPLELHNRWIWIISKSTIATKIPFFNFFPFKCLMDQIWPCHKIGQGQHRIIIYIHFKELIDATYQDSRELTQWFWRIFFCFYHIHIHGSHLGQSYIGMAAILVMWPEPNI